MSRAPVVTKIVPSSRLPPTQIPPTKRCSMADPFGYSQDRRHERALIEEYEAILEETLAKLAPHNYEIAVELASSPTKIRGFGHIKEANIQAAKICEAELLDTFRQPDNSKSAAE